MKPRRTLQNLPTVIVKCPTGKFTIRGSIPVTSHTWDEERHDAKVFGTEEECATAIRAAGITRFQMNDCSWSE